MSINSDYSNILNQQNLNTAAGLLGKSPTIAGLSGDIINQWAMLRANSAAYRKLLEAEKTGSVKQNQNYTELMSDRYFNANYDEKTGKLVAPAYKPDSSADPVVNVKTGTGETLDAMRRLALAAINNPASLTDTHYRLFENMRAAIAGNMVTKNGSGESIEVVVEDAAAAKVVQTTDFHLLTDDQNFTIAGVNGEKNYTFAIGDSLSDIVSAINADSGATGVKAEVTKNSDGAYEIILASTGAGSSSLIRVDQNVGGLFTEAGKSIAATGTDAVTQEAETVAVGSDSRAAIAAGTYTGKLFGDQSFTITGAKGSQDFTFAAGTLVEDVAAAINAAADKTGVTAEAIYNSEGVIEGLGLLAEKAGSGQYVQVAQNKGDLFTDAGSSIKAAGTSVDNTSDGPAITSLSDLGRVTIGNTTYSFADLITTGSASLTNNPGAALAVLDQALRDIYSGKAQIAGFNPEDHPMLNINQAAPTTTGNTIEIGNYGSDAMSKWIAQYVKEAAV
ncbi:MAG: hypothetical protein FWG74_04615 [Planctomycetes bacterium]|nr:hypothetical protein [Planctomycetota bacterium]